MHIAALSAGSLAGHLIRFTGAALVLCLVGSCGSSSQTMTSPGGTKCALQVQTDSTAFSSEGGRGTLQVSTARECAWTAESDAGWLSLSPDTGQGDGSVQLTVAANADPPARSGSIGVNDRRLQISQAGSPCELGVSSTHESVDATGGNRTVHVTSSSAQCQWTASSAVPWIAIVSGSAGSGNGAVTFHVNAIGELPRTGTITVAGHVVHVEQQSEQQSVCDYMVDAEAFSFGAAGGLGQMTVSAPAGCVWTTESRSPWLTITTGGTGSGAGIVGFQAAALSGPARTGTLVVAGRPITVEQSPTPSPAPPPAPSPQCSYTVEPSSYVAPATGGPGAVTVRAGAGCAWSASTTAAWIQITAGQAGSGPGEVRFTIAASNGPARTGSILIGSLEVTISQNQGCSFAAVPRSVTAAAQGASGSIQVTAGAGCEWSSASGAPWVAITGAAGGAGNGQVAYSVAANSGPARQSTLTVAGHAVSVVQASGCTYGVSPSVQDVPAMGGGAGVGVKTGAGCAWSAASAAGWLTVSPASGAGAGQVQFVAPANNGPPRSATAIIAGQTVTVNQPSPCSWTFNPLSTEVDANGSGGTVLVLVTGACTWTAESTVTWVTLTYISPDPGTGRVEFQVAPNPGPARTGVVMIGGTPYTVMQRAP